MRSLWWEGPLFGILRVRKVSSEKQTWNILFRLITVPDTYCHHKLTCCGVFVCGRTVETRPLQCYLWPAAAAVVVVVVIITYLTSWRRVMWSSCDYSRSSDIASSSSTFCFICCTWHNFRSSLVQIIYVHFSKLVMLHIWLLVHAFRIYLINIKLKITVLFSPWNAILFVYH